MKPNAVFLDLGTRQILRNRGPFARIENRDVFSSNACFVTHRVIHQVTMAGEHPAEMIFQFLAKDVAS